MSISVESNAEMLWWLLDLVENDAEPYVRHRVLEMMIDCPPFRRKEESNLNTHSLVHRLWAMMK